MGSRIWPGTGLEAQGWRDEKNLRRPIAGSMLDRDNRKPPKTPAADWETQASTLVGLRALYRLSGELVHLHAAHALEARINASFLPEAMGLDRFDRPVRCLSSVPGVLLWAGALDPDNAGIAAEYLLRPELCSQYGIRTVATSESVYDPIDTRRGRIYSYNSYLAVCGLHALGHVREAERLAKGMIRAIDTIGDYPESWTDVDGKLALAGPTKSAWTIAVRHALGQGYFDTASGLCEPLLPRL